MAGNLQNLAVDLGAALSSPFPSDGSTSPLRLKTSIFYRERRLISNSSHSLTLAWEQSGLGLALNMILLESPTIAVSTDPTIQITCNLAAYLGSLPTYGMPSLFSCTGLIIAYKVALMVSPVRIQFFNQDDSSDSIIFFEN